MRFLVIDKAGLILRGGQCPPDHVALQAGDGETAILDKWEGTRADRHRIVDGERIPYTPAVRIVPYTESRHRAYPPIADQLDAIWKGGEAMEAMRAQILAIKKAIPKEN